jgi:putative transposase
VALSQERLEEWLASDISQLDLLVIQIDGLHVAEDIVLIGAIGIDGKGDKHVLGLVKGTTENAAAAQALLDNLIERGLDPKVPRLGRELLPAIKAIVNVGMKLKQRRE